MRKTKEKKNKSDSKRMDFRFSRESWLVPFLLEFLTHRMDPFLET